MSIHTEEEGPVNVLQFPVVTNRLSDRQDVPLVECHTCSRSAMARRAKHDTLLRLTRVGTQLVVGGDELWNVHQDRGISWFSSGGTNTQLAPLVHRSRESHSIGLQLESCCALARWALSQLRRDRKGRSGRYPLLPAMPYSTPTKE